MKKWVLSGMAILNPDKTTEKVNILIEDGRISSVSSKDMGSHISFNAGGVISAGLINSHDHFLGNYWPKVGNGPYENWLPWDNDLKSSPVYQERQQIENRDLYLLAAYRNLISGVTTASDHIPPFVAEPYYDILPVKAIREYALAHSITSFALAWGEGIEAEYKKAVANDIPFITHIAEGFDHETIKDIATLDKQGGLGDHSVLIHGIAFSESDMDLIKKKNASVVWCGDSNIFMFNKTTNIKMLLEKKINVCIGTDSPMSGGENILYEMHFDRKLYKKLYGEELSDEIIYKMV
ncbi:MAG TPA: amidohydrolase family protein, partial [Spirochaetota bacterium]|nr:amidohydrolase family protein [Spirochaetota bacterium]